MARCGRARARSLRPRDSQRPARCRGRAALVLSRSRDGCERRPLGGAGAGELRHVRRRRILLRSAPPLARRCSSAAKPGRRRPRSPFPGGRRKSVGGSPRPCRSAASPRLDRCRQARCVRARRCRAPGRPVRRSRRCIRWRTPAGALHPGCGLALSGSDLAVAARAGRRAARRLLASSVADHRGCDDGAGAAAQAVAVARLLADRAASGGWHRGDRHRRPDGPGRVPQWRASRRHGRPAVARSPPGRSRARRRLDPRCRVARAHRGAARPARGDGARASWARTPPPSRSPRSCKAERGRPAARSRARAAPTARRRSGSSATARYFELEHRGMPWKASRSSITRWCSTSWP